MILSRENLKYGGEEASRSNLGMAVTDGECRSWRCCKEGSSGIDQTFCVHCSRRPDFDIHLQAFEGLTLAEKLPTGGRRLTSQVRCDLDCIAARIKLAAVEKAKKGPPMQSFPLPKLK